MEEDVSHIEIKNESPEMNGWMTFISFVLFGFLPLISYALFVFFSIAIDALTLSIVFALGTMFILGSYKAKILDDDWIKGGLETLLVGGFAAGAAFLIGNFLAFLL